MTELKSTWRARATAAALVATFVATLIGAPGTAQAQGRVTVRNGDYIVVVVNQELVTAGEIGQMHQPGRVPEITDVLLCGLGSLALALAGNRDANLKPH